MTAFYDPYDVDHWLRSDTCSHPECSDEDGGSNGCTHAPDFPPPALALYGSQEQVELDEWRAWKDKQ